jgi:hypothetical protein
MSFFSNLLANYITGRILGGKKGGNIAALGTAGSALFQQGLGSDGFNLNSLFGGGPEKTANVMGPGKIAQMADPLVKADVDRNLAEAVTRKAAGETISKINPIFKQGEGTLGYADFLVKAGVLDPNSKVTNLLNTKVGEALATGVGSQLASKLSSSGGGSSGSVSSPFGGLGDISINAIRPIEVAAGGYIDDQYFPRRNGGIMPSEGSGQKDDVPAMLMAGEFVLTKDAVKGLGNGDSNRGIEKAYSMMNKLENKANNYG